MKQKFDLAYGENSLSLEIPDGIEALTVLPKDMPPEKDPIMAVKTALSRPSGTPPLLAMLQERKPGKITIVVNDETRPTPYESLFPPLLEIFEKAQIADDKITFVIATGIHPPQSDKLNEKIYGREMTKRFRFINHIATDRDSLVDLGLTSSGYKCYINRLAVECDFLITIGVVMPHYFAGFSGGRKSILPGIAGHETVASNHARMVELLDYLPPIKENPVSLEMIEIARKVGVDFIINTVTNGRKEIVKVAAGDLVKAWYEAVDVSAAMYEVSFTKEVDICVASACGYPRDVNVYQAQKALEHAEHITRPGGTIIWIGESKEGYGDKVFEKWLNRHLKPAQLMEKIRKDFELGGHKAYAIAKTAIRNDVAFISNLSVPETELLFVRKADSAQDAFEAALTKYGPNASVAVMPQACLTLPVKR